MISLLLASCTVWHFLFALLLLGVGWSFMFIGGTALPFVAIALVAAVWLLLGVSRSKMGA